MSVSQEFNCKNCVINLSMNLGYQLNRKNTKAWDLSIILKLNFDWNVVVSYLCFRILDYKNNRVTKNLSVWVCSFLVWCRDIFNNRLSGVLITYNDVSCLKNTCLTDEFDCVLKFDWPLSGIINGRTCCLLIYLEFSNSLWRLFIPRHMSQ